MLLAAQVQAVSPVVVWDFNGSDPTQPSLGAGSWHPLGGVTNSLAAGTGSSDPFGSGDKALTLSHFPAATNTATAAGIEFHAVVSGYRDVSLHFDLRATATASRLVRCTYSLDGGATYQEGPRLVLTNAGVFQNGLVIPFPNLPDLPDLPDAPDQPELRVRLLSGAGDAGRFEGVAGSYSPSGTWRLDHVEFVGEPRTPLPPVIPVAAPVLTFTNRIAPRLHAGEPAAHSWAEIGLRPGERLELHVTVQDTNHLPVTLQSGMGNLPSTATWELPNQPAASSQAILRYTATAADAGHAFRFGLTTDNGQTQTWWWSLYIPTPAEQKMVISEFLANPPTGSSEFIELVNRSDEALDLKDWTLSDAAAIRHRFGNDSRVDGGHAVVLWGGAPPGETPAPAITQHLRASTGGLSLNNGGDTLILRNALSNLIDRVVYRGSELTNQSSLVRRSLPDGAFVPHRTLSPEPWSPGQATAGESWRDTPSGEMPTLRVGRSPAVPDVVELRWAPLEGRSARILRSLGLDTPFSEIARDLVDGFLLDPLSEEGAFYRMEWQ